MKQFKESRLLFEFGNRWHVFKLDEHRDYRERIGKIDDTKAVDFIGILDDSELYLIEVKNYRGDRIKFKDKLLKGALHKELAQKIRDSVACIIGAYRTSSVPEHWAAYAKLLCNKKREIRIILWLEYDLPPHPYLRKKMNNFLGARVFKQKLKWLTNQVQVENVDKQALPDVKVSNLG